jgi:hypothetical protein
MANLESDEAIQEACRRLLEKAAVRDAIPTPVETIVSAAELEFGADDLFADETLDRAPGELGQKVRALRGKLRALLDRRERKVYVNPDIELLGRRNFHTLHEVGHDLLDWQRDLVYADDDLTLSPKTKVLQEREAHFASAELLFQGDFFDRLAAEYRIGLAEITDLSQKLGASTHAGFRRFSERHRAPVAGVVLKRSPIRMAPLTFKREEAMCTPLWRERFDAPSTWPRFLDVTKYPFLAETGRLNLEPLPIAFTTEFEDRDGERREVHGELISNHYNLMVLLWVPQRAWLARRRVLATSTGTS